MRAKPHYVKIDALERDDNLAAIERGNPVRPVKMHFEWDARKSKINHRKHGVSFDEAQSAFYDEDARLIPDDEHSDDEDRFVLLGLSRGLRLLVVCHCYRQDDEVIRIISARKATRIEAESYNEFKS